MSFILPFGFAYFALGMQLMIGFPPLYRKMGAPPKRELLRILPFIFLMWVAFIIFIATDVEDLLTLVGVLAICGAVRIRMSLAEDENAPAHVPLGVASLGRMAAFDIWTIGGAMLLGLLAS